ncbi:MAG: transposase [Verrucomicrobia bacterium]|nr:transposase [Verrucomicrobiota bacterium]
MQKIEQVFKAHAQRYCSPRVTRALRQQGRRVGKNRVAPADAPAATGGTQKTGFSS